MVKASVFCVFLVGALISAHPHSGPKSRQEGEVGTVKSDGHALDKRGAPRHDGVMVDKAHGSQSAGHRLGERDTAKQAQHILPKRNSPKKKEVGTLDKTNDHSVDKRNLVWLEGVVNGFGHQVDKRGAPRHDGAMVDKAHGSQAAGHRLGERDTNKNMNILPVKN